MNKAYSLLILSLFILIELSGQYSFNNYKHLTKADGLPHTNALEVVEDRYGFIWIATGNGLVRYDGSKVHLLERSESDTIFLLGNYIKALLAEGDSLWVGTKSGLSIVNLVDGAISNITLPIDLFLGEVTTRNRHQLDLIWDIMKDRQGNIWLAQTFGGFTKWEKSTRTFKNFPMFPDTLIAKNYSESDQTTLVELIQDNKEDSIIWGASMAGLVRLNQANNTIKRIWYSKDNEKTQFQVNRKICVFQGLDGAIYSGSWTGGLSIYYPKTKAYVYPTIPKELKGNHLWGVRQSNPNVLYMNYLTGLYAYNRLDSSFQLIIENKAKEALRKSYGVEFIDSKERAWYPSENGIIVADPMTEQFRWHSIASHNQTKIPSIGRSVIEGFYPGYISITGQFSDGLYHVNKTNGHVIKNDLSRFFRENDAFQSWGMIQLDENTLLFFGSRKLYTFQKDTQQIEPYDVQIPVQHSALGMGVKDSSGIIWFGSNADGLFTLNPKTKTVESYQKEIPYASVGRLFLDTDQNVWMVSNSGHMVYNAKQREFHIFDIKTDSSSTFLFARNFCSCPNGELWLAGEKEGIGQLSSKYPEKGVFRKIPILDEHGKTVTISRIACSPNDDLWAIDNDALYKIDRSNWKCQTISFDYGIKRWSGLFQFLQSGELFIGGRDGFYTVQPSTLSTNETPPVPYISRIITNKGVKNRLENHFRNVPIVLSPQEKLLTVEFSAINHTLSSKLKFQYQLEGVDEGWIDPGNKRALTYSYLPAGKYTFKLKAFNNEGEESTEIYELLISVIAPWYRTATFWICLTLAAISVVYYWYRRRIQQIQKANELKSNFERRVANLEMSALRAQMNPHFIFNCLSSIESYIIRNDTKKASEYLNTFGRLVRLILQNSRNSYVNLQEELQSIKLYLELEQMRFKNTFTYAIEMKENLNPDELEIPPMLIQPFVENAIWHGLNHLDEGGVVHIEVKKDLHSLVCIVEDNGIGRVAAQKIRAAQRIKRKSMGMQITHERIQTINKIYSTNIAIKIDDLYDFEKKPVGTRITLNIPI